MKFAYRFLALALVAITLLGSFAACADTKEPATDTTVANASTEAPAATTEAEATTESPYDENGYLKSSLPDELDF